jgi:hypothetical protein
LKLNQWVCLDGCVHRITNMRGIGVSSRLIELSRREPVYLGAGQKLTAFDVEPPPPDGAPPAPDPPPTHPKRRRAAPGAGRAAPGRR